MTLEKALASRLPCYANANGKHFVIHKDSSLYVSWDLPNGKTEFECFYQYYYAFADYKLQTYNWHIMEY